jgi:hypothetical protein
MKIYELLSDGEEFRGPISQENPDQYIFLCKSRLARVMKFHHTKTNSVVLKVTKRKPKTNDAVFEFDLLNANSHVKGIRSYVVAGTRLLIKNLYWQGYRYVRFVGVKRR